MTSIFITCASSYTKESMQNLNTSVFYTETAKKKDHILPINPPIKMINYKMKKDITWYYVSRTWRGRDSYDSFSL